MICFLSRYYRGISYKWKMNSRVRNQVGLEFIEINVQSPIKSERCRYGGDNLPYKPVEVGVGRPIDVKIPAANVVDGLVVDHEGAVRVFEGGVRGQNTIVRLHDGGR